MLTQNDSSNGNSNHGTYVENPDNIALFHTLRAKLPAAYLVALVDDEGNLQRDNGGLEKPARYIELAEANQGKPYAAKLQYSNLTSGLASIGQDTFPYSRDRLGSTIDSKLLKPDEDAVKVYSHLSKETLLARRFDKILQSGKSFVLATHSQPYHDIDIEPTNENLKNLELKLGLQSPISYVVVQQESPVKLRLVDLADADKRQAFTEALTALPDLLPKEPNAQVEQAGVSANAKSTIDAPDTYML